MERARRWVVGEGGMKVKKGVEVVPHLINNGMATVQRLQLIASLELPSPS